MSDWCFMLLPSCSSDHACSLPKDEGACFIVLLRQWRENLPYVLYTEAAEETATVLILESIARHFVSVSKSRFAIFNQYNVNNVKLNSWDFHSTQGKMYNGVYKLKGTTNFLPPNTLKNKGSSQRGHRSDRFCTFFSDSAHGLIIKHQFHWKLLVSLQQFKLGFEYMKRGFSLKIANNWWSLFMNSVCSHVFHKFFHI